MERLRAAIEQARKTREEGGANVHELSSAVAEAPAPAAPTRNGSANGNAVKGVEAPVAAPQPRGDVQAHWDALEKIQLKPARMRRNRLVMDGKTPERGAFDMLRTRLLTMMQKENWRRVAVTSPTMACGKSTTTLNLALALSRMPDIRTIVIETDMRRPSMAKMLGVKGEHSVFDLFAGRANFSEMAVRIGSNVALAMNHGVARNPAELLHGQSTPALLRMIEETYQPDVVLFDMPPMLQSDDALGFIQNVDCAVLIALAESTTLSQVDVCEAELAQHTNVAGVVLNRCRYTGAGYGYAYGYGDY